MATVATERAGKENTAGSAAVDAADSKDGSTAAVAPPPAESAPARSGIPDAAAEAPATARRCFQILGFDVMLDAALTPWLLEVNHSPSMALKGNEEQEVQAKCSVIRAALKLGLAEQHTDELCKACEVAPLHTIARPLCALEPVRALFEAHATSRSGQQWTMNAAAFERLLQPAESLVAASDSDGGPLDLRSLFADACAARQDTGSGWDAPAPGQLTLWAWTEALLRVAKRVAAAEEHGLAAPLARVLAAMR